MYISIASKQCHHHSCFIIIVHSVLFIITMSRSLGGLVSWLTSNDAMISQVEEKTVAGVFLFGGANVGCGTGIFASCEIAEDAIVARIPRHCLVKLDTLAYMHARYPG